MYGLIDNVYSSYSFNVQLVSCHQGRCVAMLPRCRSHTNVADGNGTDVVMEQGILGHET